LRQGLLAGTEYGYCSAAGAAGAAAAAPSPAPDIAQSLDTAVVARRTTIDGAKCRLPVMFRCAQLRCLMQISSVAAHWLAVWFIAAVFSSRAEQQRHIGVYGSERQDRGQR